MADKASDAIEVKYQPFWPGDNARCIIPPDGGPLNRGAEYRIIACSIIGRFWSVRLDGPHGFSVFGAPMWYLAKRFVRIGH